MHRMKDAIVDAHLHVWEMPSPRFPWNPLRGMRPAEPAPVELLLQTMQENHVHRAVIVQPSNYGYDHSYLAECLARHPGRFGAVALFDFRAADANERLATLVVQGMRGVRLYLYHEPDLSWVDDGSIDPLMERAAELGVVVIVFGRWDMLSCIGNLAGRHRGVRFVLDHLGHPEAANPETWPHVLRLADLPNVYIKVSDFPTLSRQPYPFADLFPFVRQVRSAFGATRMMWASNFPHILRQAGYGQALQLVDAALPDLSDDERGWIMGRTAAGLWAL